jgi:hypothetical protein
MLVNFPKPYADELVYSLIARHLWLQPPTSLKSAAASAFATKHALAVVDLPARLGALSDAIGDKTGMNVQRLIRNHTLLPLYSPFMPAQRLALIEKNLTGNGGGAVHFSAGIMASGIRPAFRLRFCPVCAADERQNNGEAYWHRLHQAVGVFVCPEHNSFLEESAVPVQFRRTRHLFVPAQDAIQDTTVRNIDAQEPNHQILLRIAQSAKWLLQNYQSGNYLSELKARYVGYATKLGLVTGSGRLKWKELTQALQNRFPEQLLHELQCSIPAGASDHWMARILRGARAVQAPIRHLLLMDFLEISPETFFASNTVVKLFGDGPWVCDNPVCPSAGQPIMTEITCGHSYEHRRPLGVLTCPACGQVKCRVSSQTGERGWIRDFGPVWKRALADLWIDPTVSVRKIAYTLRVDSLTVKRHAAKVSLPFPRIGKRIAGKQGPPQLRGERKLETSSLPARQQEWCKLVLQSPTATATELRALAPACYAYLYRHDARWLHEHSPIGPFPHQIKERVDWSLRDLNLSKSVAAAKFELLREAGRPKLISISALGRQIRALAWIQKHPSRLPLTRSALSSVAESRTEFACRRIAWAAEQLRGEQRRLRPWLLLQKAALRNDLCINPQVQAVIRRQMLRPLNNQHQLANGCHQ